jgi:spore maturation protein A
MNIIWIVLMCASIIIAIFTGRVDELTKAMFEAGKSAVEVSLYLLGIVAIWLGITKILEDGGLVKNIAHFFRPLITRMYRNIP